MDGDRVRGKKGGKRFVFMVTCNESKDSSSGVDR